MADASIEGSRHAPRASGTASGIMAVAAGVPLPTITATLGHANLQTIVVYTTAADLASTSGIFRPGCGKGRGILPELVPEGYRRGRVTRMAWAVTRQVGPPCALRTLLVR